MLRQGAGQQVIQRGIDAFVSTWHPRPGLALRVLLACDSLGIGGAERHVIGLAAALRRRGHEVTIACSMGGPLGAHVASSGVVLKPLCDRLVKRRVSISYARLLAALVGSGRFDLVHAHMHASSKMNLAFFSSPMKNACLQALQMAQRLMQTSLKLNFRAM